MNTFNLKEKRSSYLLHQMRVLMLEWRNELAQIVRSPSFAIPALIFPIMFYGFFGLIFNKTGTQGTGYLMATYGVFGIIGPALFSFGVGISTEKDQGWLAIKLSSPMPISFYLIAKILSAMCFSVIIITSLLFMAAFLGGVRLETSQWLLTYLILLIGNLPFCGLGLWLGLSLKSNAAPAVVNLIYLPMAFLSGLWIPINFLPEAIQWLAWIFPAYHLAQIVLSVQQLAQPFDLTIHIIALAVMTFVFISLAVRAFRLSFLNR